MSAVELLHVLARLDVRLTLDQDKVRVSAPRGAIGPDLRQELGRCKHELLAVLRSRAGDPIFLDFETRSLAALKDIGGRRYAEHPSTEALCVVAQMPDGTVVEWTSGEPPPALVITAARSGTPVVAHNGRTFDKFIWEALGWPTVTWIDSMDLAGLAGLPLRLEDMAEQVLGRQKDKQGRALTLRLSRAAKNGELRPVSKEEMEAVVRYCRNDVALLADAWRIRLAALRETETDVRAIHATINDRGFQIDVDLARAIIDCETKLGAELRAHAGVAEDVVRSPHKLLSHLALTGVTVTNIQKETLERLLLDRELPEQARRIVEARLASSGIATGKLTAALARRCGDGRLRDSLVYHGAHTGRWAGKGFQPQNLPRGVKKLDVAAAVRAALDGNHASLHGLAEAAGVGVRSVLAALVRSCICASSGQTLGAVDFSAVEPRALAWFVGDDDRLAMFRRAEDIYKLMAAKLFGVKVADVTQAQRDAGKPPELGCGYGMGADRFRTYAEALNVDWATMPMSPGEVVDLWRDDNPLITGDRVGLTAAGRPMRRGGLWRKLEEAAMRACRGDRVVVSSTTWERDGADIVCVLPSGRRMVYRQALIEMVRATWGELTPTVTYLHYEKGHVTRTKTYGGKLTENVISAICRDVLADALLRLEKVGIRVVLHVHDEIVAELPDVARFEEMKALMATPPSWASGLPLAVEGYVSSRYRK